MRKENIIMSFDINKWKKFLLAEAQQPGILEEALEDRVPISVAEEIREDISTLPWVIAGDVTGKKQPQDVKGVENLLADWFVQVHDPKDHMNPRRASEFDVGWAKYFVMSIIRDFREKAKGETNYHRHPIPSGHYKSRTFEIISLLEYDKNLNISLAQAYWEMIVFQAANSLESRKAAWDSVKTRFMTDPNTPKEAWVDRPMPDAWMTTIHPANLTKPAVFRIAKGFKQYKIAEFPEGFGWRESWAFPFDIDFTTNAPTFQTIIDYLGPFDEQFNKITGGEELQDYYDEANRLIMRSFGRVSAREMKLTYNYLVGKPKKGLPESSLEKIKAVADDTEKYFGEQDPLSYKIINGVHKRLKKILSRDQDLDNEMKDEALVKLQRHFLIAFRRLYKTVVRSNDSLDIMEFLGQKESNWKQLKGKSLMDARKYAAAAVNNFQSEDQIRIKYPDGSYWYEIGAAGCEGDEDNEWRDKELKKAAQRHANCASDRHGSLWTLRYKDKDGLIESEVMISYFREYNRIGQIKGSLPKATQGQGNLAPAKKWWRHILDLVNQLKVTEIAEYGAYTSPDEQGKFEPFLLWIKKNAKHDVSIEFREEPPQWGPAEFPAQNPWEPGGEQPFQERLRRNLNLKPKKKLSNNAQAKLEWYKRRKRK